MSCQTGTCDKGSCEGECLRLHYFNGRGLAEIVRFILHAAKKNFEDVRYSKEEWEALKAKCTADCKSDVACQFPTGKMPVLEIKKEGKSYYLTQSVTIARAMAHKFGLAGENAIEHARCDEVVDSVKELMNMTALAKYEECADRKEKIKTRLREQEYPRILGFLERRLHANGGKHMVGNKTTWADFAVALFIDAMVKHSNDETEAKIVEKLPGLSALAKSVDAIPEIAAWIAKRPVTEF